MSLFSFPCFSFRTASLSSLHPSFHSSHPLLFDKACVLFLSERHRVSSQGTSREQQVQPDGSPGSCPFVSLCVLSVNYNLSNVHTQYSWAYTHSHGMFARIHTLEHIQLYGAKYELTSTSRMLFFTFFGYKFIYLQKKRFFISVCSQKLTHVACFFRYILPGFASKIVVMWYLSTLVKKERMDVFC